MTDLPALLAVARAAVAEGAAPLSSAVRRRRSEPLCLRRFASGDPGLADRVDQILADDSTE
ncbi:hypothetical protein [Nocardia rhamnosiphila]